MNAFILALVFSVMANFQPTPKICASAWCTALANAPNTCECDRWVDADDEMFKIKWVDKTGGL